LESTGNEKILNLYDVARNADGRLEAFGMRSDGELMHIKQKSPSSPDLDNSWNSLERMI
jgi:hypothetical protein